MLSDAPDRLASAYARADTDNTPIVASLRLNGDEASLQADAESGIQTSRPLSTSTMFIDVDISDPNAPLHVKIYRAVMCLSCLYQNRKLAVPLAIFFALIILMAYTNKASAPPPLPDGHTRSPTTYPAFAPLRFDGGTLDKLDDNAAFGAAVAASADGLHIVIGAPLDDSEGRIFTYLRKNNQWDEYSWLIPGSYTGKAVQFGTSVAVSGGGEQVVVGAPRNNDGMGAVFAATEEHRMDYAEMEPISLTTPIDPNAHFGASVAINVAGDLLAAGAVFDKDDQGMCTGSVLVFAYVYDGPEPEDMAWKQVGPKLIGQPYTGTGCRGFGSGLALDAAGNTLAVGAAQDKNGLGGVFIFVRSATGAWSQQGSILVGVGAVAGTGTFGQGTSVALSADGNILVSGAPNDANLGAAWFFMRNPSSGKWSQMGSKIQAPGFLLDQGRSVAITGDGLRAFVGAPGKGVGGVMICRHLMTNHTWVLMDQFYKGPGAKPNGQSMTGGGASVATDSAGSVVVFGAPLETGPGAAYIVPGP